MQTNPEESKFKLTAPAQFPCFETARAELVIDARPVPVNLFKMLCQRFQSIAPFLRA
jgi:hypothetical protein